ncbi:MAG: NAD(P)H-hydrate dehydratase, partial [Lachnospiraceae bacterium]|nr:NAD(P)H-hydrate dehydratase [Lachnospiraceae bacterium]
MRTEITGGFVRDHLPPVPADADKFTRGHLFMVCGSYGMAGAAVLAARSALRTGVGYLTAAVPEQVWPVFTAAVPEAVCLVYDGQDPDSVREAMKKGVRRADAVLAGCGLGTLRDRVLPVLLPICGKPLLLDADGLNYLARAGYGTPLENEPAPAGAAASWSASPDTVLTPHAGEMARLLSGTAEDVQADRVRALERALSLYGGTVLLKGPRTLVGHGGSRNGGTQPGGIFAEGSRPGESLPRETQPDGIFDGGSETGGTMPSGTGS